MRNQAKHHLRKLDYVNMPTESSCLNTAQKMKFSIEDLFSKCDQILSFQRIRPLVLKKSLMENSIFCVVKKR